jgi:hypothetical protein
VTVPPAKTRTLALVAKVEISCEAEIAKPLAPKLTVIPLNPPAILILSANDAVSANDADAAELAVTSNKSLPLPLKPALLEIPPVAII